jgi:hypothetical protein
VGARVGASLDAAGLAAHGLAPREIREFLDKLQPRALPDFELDVGRMRPAAEIEAEMLAAVPRPDREAAG